MRPMKKLIICTLTLLAAAGAGRAQSVPALLAEALPGQGVTFNDNGNMTVSVGNTGSLPGAAGDVMPVPAGIMLS